MFYEAARRLVVITRSLLMTQLQVSIVLESKLVVVAGKVVEDGERERVHVSMLCSSYCQSTWRFVV